MKIASASPRNDVRNNEIASTFAKSYGVTSRPAKTVLAVTVIIDCIFTAPLKSLLGLPLIPKTMD